MKIYIDNEEVLCASQMTIKEQIKNTNSVILNNVFPKSWEADKDYVSNFYMPKDYSHCKIIDENITSEKTYDLTNNITYVTRRFINGADGKMIYRDDAVIVCLKVVPGKEYKIKADYQQTGSIGIFQTDSLNIGVTTDKLILITPGSNDVTLTPTKKYLIATYKYSTYTYVTFKKITTDVSNNLIFSGIVKNSGNINLNPRYPHYATLQILDYKAFLSEGETLNYVLKAQMATEAIKTIIKDLKGFYVGELKINDIPISAYSCSEKTPYDVLEYLAEITGAIWYTQAISDDIVLINFYAPDQLPTAQDIEYTQKYFKDNKIEDIQYAYSAKDYRNKQIIVNDKATGKIAQTEYITYEGKNLQTIYPISSIVSIKNNTKVYSFTTETAKKNGQLADFYYSFDSNSIEVGFDLGTGKTIEVIYYPIIISRQIAYNQDEIERISESTKRNGIITRYEKRTDTSDETSLAQIAQTYLDFKGVPEITLTVKSYYSDLLHVGERVFFNGPIEDLKTNYLVIEKSIEMITTGNQQVLFYTYKLSSSYNDENAINFFDNQRRKTEGNIQEGEFISRYIDLASETNIIFFDVSKQEIRIPGDILDGELDIELVETSNVLNTTLNFYL